MPYSATQKVLIVGREYISISAHQRTAHARELVQRGAEQYDAALACGPLIGIGIRLKDEPYWVRCPACSRAAVAT